MKSQEGALLEKKRTGKERKEENSLIVDNWKAAVYFVYLVGTAGAGKSRATAALKRYMELLSLNVITVNLDAGVKKLPYKADVDVRDIIDIDDLITNYDLGPNGAMIASMDLTATKIGELRDEVDYLKPEYVIVDTPGQIELFAYRSSGLLSAKGLSEEENNTAVFLVDPALAHSAESFASVMLLGVSVMYRLQLPQIFALSKTDLVQPSFIEQIVKWSEEPQSLEDALSIGRFGLRGELGYEISRMLNTLGASAALTPFSSETNENIDRLFGQLQTMWATPDDSFDIT